MKKQLIIFSAVLGMASVSHAQELSVNQVPSIIVNEFSREFPKARDVEWEIDKGLYQVEFEIGWGRDQELWYDSAAILKRQKEEMKISEIPKLIRDSIKNSYEGYSIEGVTRITEGEILVYHLELEGFLKQDWELVVDAAGNVISKLAD